LPQVWLDGSSIGGFTKPNFSSGRTSNFHHQILTSTKQLNQQRLSADGILIPHLRQALIVVRKPLQNVASKQNQPYMELKPLFGLGDFTFGMTESDVIRLIGGPDKSFLDEDDENELIYQYNRLKLRLTFYQQENGKLGYIRSSNPELTYLGKGIIGTPIEKAKTEILENLISEWEVEDFDFFSTHFNEKYWIVLNTEYEDVTDVELGVPLDDDDKYKWN